MIIIVIKIIIIISTITIYVKHITANLPTNIVDFKRLDSSIILISRDGIIMSIGDFPESLSRAILVGTILVGGLGVILLYYRARPRTEYHSRSVTLY